MIRKSFVLMIAGILALTSCGKNSNENSINHISSSKNSNFEYDSFSTDSELNLNDEWIVDGQWKVKINFVKETLNRNELEDNNPEQVVIIDYSYENIGYDDKENIMNGLFLIPEFVTDENGNLGEAYTLNEITKHAEEIPIGSKIDNVQESYAFSKKCKNLKISFLQYDGNGKKQKSTFSVPIDYVDKSKERDNQELDVEDSVIQTETEQLKDGKIHLYNNVKIVKNEFTTQSICFATQDMVNEDTLTDWYYNHVNKKDYKSYVIVYTDRDKKLGIFSNGYGQITKGANLDFDGKTYSIVDDSSATYYEAIDGTSINIQN